MTFAEAAIKKGAVAIVAEKKIKIPTGTTVIYVESTRKAMEDMVPYFFDYPSRKMRMVAVTGTNGKQQLRILFLIYFVLPGIRRVL